jgi:transposase InsO family protein
MQRTNIYLDDEQLSLLRALGSQRGQPVAELIRSAIDAWLEEQGVRSLDRGEWERRFERLLRRRRRLARELGLDELRVQSKVDETVREVRKARAARRR